MKQLKNRAEIDVAALQSNFRILEHTIREKTPDCRTMCVVKADCYGHSAEICIPALSAAGARFFAVSCMEEALRVDSLLRCTGRNDAEILILGPTDEIYVSELAHFRIIQAVYSSEYARRLEAAAKASGVRVRAAIKLDTGMNRIGFPAGNADTALRQISEVMASPWIEVVSLFTHFACADEASAMTQEQYARFLAVANPLKAAHPGLLLQCCNSAAALRFPEMHHDLVRLGIILYGLPPADGITLPGLAPVMSLYSTVTHLHEIDPGETVSYGATFRADRKMTVATVGIGYGDGLPRACGNGGCFLIRGKKAPILGRICMDQCMVDVTGIDAAIGDDAVIFDRSGENIVSLAKAADTIPYELLCLLSPRVKRIPR